MRTVSYAVMAAANVLHDEETAMLLICLQMIEPQIKHVVKGSACQPLPSYSLTNALVMTVSSPLHQPIGEARGVT